jgi:hypothetical protein
MAQAIVKFGDHEDRILTIVKGKHGFKNKTQAVNYIICQFGQELLEPELRPEYVNKLDRIRAGKYFKFSSMAELRK